MTPSWETFKLKAQKKDQVSKDQNDNCFHSSCDEYESESEDEIQYKETEASCIVKCSDVTVIRAGDDFPYYLLKLVIDPFIRIIKDDYGHAIPANTKVVQGYYFEIYKETNDGDLYYLDTSKSAIISCYSVVGICPDLTEVEQMRKRKLEKMRLVTHDMHQLLVEFTVERF